MERVWIKSKSGAVRQVAESAVPVMKVSGWKAMTKAEVAAHLQELGAQREQERTASGQLAPATEAAPNETDRPARADQQSKEN